MGTATGFGRRRRYQWRQRYQFYSSVRDKNIHRRMADIRGHMADMREIGFSRWQLHHLQIASRVADDWRYLQIKHSATLSGAAWAEHNRRTSKYDLDVWLMAQFGLDQCQARSISNRAGEASQPYTTGVGVRWIAARPEPQREDYPDITYVEAV